MQLIDALRTMQSQARVVILDGDEFVDIVRVTHIDTSALGDEPGEHAIVFLYAAGEGAE